MSNSDKEILNKLVSADKTESYRTNSFYKRIIGLYTWDILRENRKTNFTDIRKNQKTTPTSETPEMYKPTGEHYLERCPLEN